MGVADRLHYLLYEGLTHVMIVRCQDFRSAQFLGAPVLHINGPFAFRGSPKYTQWHLERREVKQKT